MLPRKRSDLSGHPAAVKSVGLSSRSRRTDRRPVGVARGTLLSQVTKWPLAAVRTLDTSTVLLLTSKLPPGGTLTLTEGPPPVRRTAEREKAS